MFTLSPTALEFHHILRDGLRLFAASFTKSLPFTLLGTIASAAPLAVVNVFFQSDNYDHRANFIIAIGLTILIYPATMSALLFHIYASARQQRVSIHDALKRGLVCLIPSLIGAIVYTISVSIATVFLIAPGILISIMFYLWWIELVVNDRGLFASFKSSVQLTYSNWWRTAFGFATVFGLLASSIQVAGIIPQTLEFTGMPEEFMGLIQLAYLLALLISFPVFLCAITAVIHHDLTLRTAGEKTERLEPVSGLAHSCLPRH